VAGLSPQVVGSRASPRLAEKKNAAEENDNAGGEEGQGHEPQVQPLEDWNGLESAVTMAALMIDGGKCVATCRAGFKRHYPSIAEAGPVARDTSIKKRARIAQNGLKIPVCPLKPERFLTDHTTL